MNILFGTFLFEENRGGAVDILFRLLKHTSFQDNSIAILTTSNVKKIELENLGAIRVYKLPPYNLYWVGNKNSQPVWKKIIFHVLDLWNPFMFQVAKTVIEKEQPEVIHTHKIRGISPSVWKAARLTGTKKIIHTCHDYELISPNGTLEGILGKMVEIRSPLIYPYVSIRRSFTADLDLITYPSEYIRNVHRMVGYSSVKEVVIPNTHGLTLKELRRNRESRNIKNLGNDYLQILYLGRLEKEKGVLVICEAFDRVLAQGAKAKLIIAGTGSLYHRLQMRYRENHRVQMVGFVSGQNKDRLLQESDVLVCPSICKETFGIVVIEAYAYGKPVIASNIGALSEVVEDEKSGFLFSAGDVDELASLILNLCNNKHAIDEMKSYCYKIAEKYCVEEVLSKYIETYTL